MTPQEYYRMTGPTERAGPPAWYTPTSLVVLLKCPLRWQLENSRWGDLESHPGTPNRKRVAGKVIHELLEAMFRHLGRRGRPARGTEAFRDAMRTLKVTDVLTEIIQKQEIQWRSHPRTRGAPLSLDPGSLRNRVFGIFRKTYRPATNSPSRKSSSGPLGAEVTISDEELRFRGRIDLAQVTELTDFKTGSLSESHKRQLEIYALLWFRQRKVNPKLTLVYPDESHSWRLSEAQLQALHDELETQLSEFDEILSKEAPAQTGEHCHHCDVRAFCNEYWLSPLPGDIQFIVDNSPSQHAIGAGELLVGIHSAHVASVGEINLGDRVRLLRTQTNGEETVLPVWGELFISNDSKES